MIVTRRYMLAGLVAVPAVAFAATRGSDATGRIYNNGGVAIDGSDAVAYFTEGKPVAGDVTINHDWNGVRWHFSTIANRDTFAANPEAYAPRYGGYCAWAVSQGSIARSTPEAWAVVDGKLYLNFSKRIQRRWEGDIPNYIARADRNWPTLDVG